MSDQDRKEYMSLATPAESDRVLSLVYDELRRVASVALRSERRSHTLQPTALVHEVFLKLQREANPIWNNPQHFYFAAARAMRQILIDRARAKATKKRSADGIPAPVAFIDVSPTFETEAESLLALDESLLRLEALDPEASELVRVRFYGGLGMEDAAKVLGISLRTANRRWAFARAWLFRDLNGRCGNDA